MAVYPAIKISRTISKVSETSVPGVSEVGTAFTVSLARIEGGAGAVPEKAAGLLDRFEGAKALRGALAYSPKDKNAKITKVVAELPLVSVHSLQDEVWPDRRRVRARG